MKKVMTNSSKVPFESLSKEEEKEELKSPKSPKDRQLDVSYDRDQLSPTALSIKSGSSSEKSSSRASRNVERGGQRPTEIELAEDKREGRSNLKKRTPIKKNFEFSVDSNSQSRERSNDKLKGNKDKQKPKLKGKMFKEDKAKKEILVSPKGKTDLKIE